VFLQQIQYRPALSSVPFSQVNSIDEAALFTKPCYSSFWSAFIADSCLPVCLPLQGGAPVAGPSGVAAQARAFAAAPAVKAFAAEEVPAFVAGEQAPAFAAPEQVQACVVVVRVWDWQEHEEHARAPVDCYYWARSSPAGDAEQPVVCFPDD
jgi:hypothetical protein